jgi:polyisoprenoid-binding protein YceI
MKTPLKFSIAALPLVLSSFAALGHAAFSAPKDVKVGFAASGPAGLKIEGSTKELTVTEADGNVTVDVPLASLATGIALRDQHMKDKYLEVSKYPLATLTVARSALKVPANGARASADAPATLKLHGQARPVTVHYDATTDADGTGVAIHGELHIRMDDFGIAIPSYLGVTVKPPVDVTADFKVAGN